MYQILVGIYFLALKFLLCPVSLPFIFFIHVFILSFGIYKASMFSILTWFTPKPRNMRVTLCPKCSRPIPASCQFYIFRFV
jgi:hypothetical protein